jgi:hypothetical protein
LNNHRAEQLQKYKKGIRDHPSRIYPFSKEPSSAPEAIRELSAIAMALSFVQKVIVLSIST